MREITPLSSEDDILHEAQMSQMQKPPTTPQVLTPSETNRTQPLPPTQPSPIVSPNNTKKRKFIPIILAFLVLSPVIFVGANEVSCQVKIANNNKRVGTLQDRFNTVSTFPPGVSAKATSWDGAGGSPGTYCYYGLYTKVTISSSKNYANYREAETELLDAVKAAGFDLSLEDVGESSPYPFSIPFTHNDNGTLTSQNLLRHAVNSGSRYFTFNHTIGTEESLMLGDIIGPGMQDRIKKAALDVEVHTAEVEFKLL